MERVKVRRVGQRRSDRGQRDLQAETLALVPQPGELTGERRVAAAAPEAARARPRAAKKSAQGSGSGRV
jgi:hypothetical protein